MYIAAVVQLSEKRQVQASTFTMMRFSHARSVRNLALTEKLDFTKSKNPSASKMALSAFIKFAADV